jgi:hypothetical protein
MTRPPTTMPSRAISPSDRGARAEPRLPPMTPDDSDLERPASTSAGGYTTQLLAITSRQVWRLCEAYKHEGPAGLASKRRGRPSNP